jgi:hypothetical protein
MRTAYTGTTGRNMSTLKLSELDRASLAFYTGKWFLLWSFKFLLFGLVVICAVWALVGSAARNSNKS